MYQVKVTVWGGNISITPGTIEKLGTLSSNALDGFSCLMYGNSNGYGFLRVKNTDVYFHCMANSWSEWYNGSNSY